MAEITDTSPSEEAAIAAEGVPERPQWLPSDPPAAPQDDRPRRRKRKRASTPLVVQSSADGDEAPRSLKTRFVFWVTSVAATGYGLSLIIHALLLTVMGLYVLPSLINNDDITTVVQSDAEVPEEFDMLVDIALDSPAGSEEIVKPQHTEMIEQDAEITKLEHDFLTDVTAAEAKGDNGSTTGSGGGFRLLEPKNAVRKGSFTAWTIPIARRFGEKPKAGDSPRPGQAYYVVIQVKLKKGQRTYKINDLSGKIIGSDGYGQLIPAQAFVQEKNGKLTRAKIGRMLPIIDGVSQILIKVPGAEALVKDTIMVKSRSLKEQQTLELVFGKRDQ